MRPLVKICGLTRVEDAELAVSLGADFIGAVRTKVSPRCVSVSEARAIFARVGSRAARVLVFRDCHLDDALDDARGADADWVQLYHASDKEVMRAREEGFRVLRVYTMTEESPSLPEFDSAPSIDAPALLDVGGGGSGRSFDWQLLGAEAPAFTFVAGGVGPGNVDTLLEHRPYGIDLASGVERAPGVKDEGKLRDFFDRIGRRPR